MLNYNLNINSPLQQEKKNEDVQPPINWSFASFVTASDSTDLPELSFATMSINATNSNCIQISNDNSGDFITDAQFPVTASMTGSNWPITGSTTMSIFTSGITYDPLAVNQYYFAGISASAAQISANPSLTGSKITNNFSASEFYRFYTDGRIFHTKGNVYNGPINWRTKNVSPINDFTQINGYSASFSIVKNLNESLASIQEVTGSAQSSSFNNFYALNITASFTANVNNVTGSTTMSFEIPEAGLVQTARFFNPNTSVATGTGSFVAMNNSPYAITSSVIFNKGNLSTASINYKVSSSSTTQDLEGNTAQLNSNSSSFNLKKDIAVLVNYNNITASISGIYSNDYSFNQTASLTSSILPNTTGSVTMSLEIPEIGFSTSSKFFNPTSAGIKILSASFVATTASSSYNITASVINNKGNESNSDINWNQIAKSDSQDLENDGNFINGNSSSFNIVKDRNVSVIAYPYASASHNGTFSNDYAFNITSSLTASILANTTGSVTMSLIIPEIGFSTSSKFYNETSAGVYIFSASFVATTDSSSYNITGSIINNKGNIWNSKLKLLATGSNFDSYSMYTVPTQLNIFKDINVNPIVINQNVNLVSYPLTASKSEIIETQYAYNFETEITQSITYPSYQVYAYPTTSLTITPAGTSSLRTDSGSFISYTEQPYTASYQITASAFINKIPSLFATVVVIGAGGSGSRNGSFEAGTPGAGGGAGGFYQSDIIVAPNLPYTIEQIAKNPTDADYTKFTYYNGILPLYGSASILAFSGNSANAGAGGRSGYVNIYPSNAPAYTAQGLNNGGTNIYANGGGGTYQSASNSINANGGLDLGGAGCYGTASAFPTLYFQSASLQLTGSAGNGSTTASINGGNSTAFGGGGGGAFLTGDYAGTAGDGGPGVVIVAYSGSQKLTVPAGTITRFENGLTVHIFKQTGSFSYDYVPEPNPAEQPYQWRTETLVIAGGGCGGSDEGGGGGAGGYSYNPNFYYELGKTYNVTVGSGSAGKSTNIAPFSGSDSYIVDNIGNTIIFSKGGGNGFGRPGGSGGGASNTGDGGSNVNGYVDANYYIQIGKQNGFNGGGADPTFGNAGGGGGASSTGSIGSNPGGSGPIPNSGAGGTGNYTLDFSPVKVCGGGTGVEPGANALNLGAAWGGGLPAGTNPGTGSNATSFGSGGGAGRGIGGALSNSGAGGTGLVQIKYAGTQRATGGQVQTALLSGSYYTLHTFTASGTFTTTQ